MLGLAENPFATERPEFVKPSPVFKIVTKTDFPEVLSDTDSLERLYFELKVPKGFVFKPRPIDGYTRTLCFQGPDVQNYFFAGFGFGIGNTEEGVEANTYYSKPEYEIPYEELNAIRRVLEGREGLGIGLQIDKQGNATHHTSPDLFGTIGKDRVEEKLRKTAIAKRLLAGSGVITPEFILTLSTLDPRKAGYIYRLPANLVSINEAPSLGEDLLLNFVQQLAFTIKILHKRDTLHLQLHGGNYHLALQPSSAKGKPGRFCLTDFSTLTDISTLSNVDIEGRTSLSKREYMKLVDLHTAVTGALYSLPSVLTDKILLMKFWNALASGYSSEEITMSTLRHSIADTRYRNKAYGTNFVEDLSTNIAMQIINGNKKKKTH
ncbi:MAG TPA: hypothetical protein PK863_05300 [Candidatus Dojkabacteria bacterium]|nr:hypothetical protein [Candidatus Dojkabacteria bacterium]HRP51811.1 hypothetical protein [Candidatus Dojkabacteria bacterium]